MEYVPSIKITDAPSLDGAGVAAADRERLAEMLARAYLRQLCANRFFSTDPHPGNLGVEARPEGVPGGAAPPPRLVFYDLGQACTLDDGQAGGILDVIESTVDMDAAACVNAFKRMGVLVEGADDGMVQRKVQDNFDTGKVQVKRKKLKKRGYVFKDPVVPAAAAGGDATDDGGKVKDSEVMAFFTLPAEYAFVARALSQMDGVGKGLDRDFDFISSSAPYIVEVKGTAAYLGDEAKKLVQGVERGAQQLADELKKIMRTS